jgi:hypothetical protein
MSTVGQPPAELTKVNKDGTFDVRDGKSLKTVKLVFFEKTLYKLAYQDTILSSNEDKIVIRGFYARSIKTYNSCLLIHATCDAEEHLFSYKGPSDSSMASPKLLDVDSTVSSWDKGIKLVLPHARQVLLTLEQMIFLSAKTSIGASCRAKSP